MKLRFLTTEPAVSGGSANTFTKPIPKGRFSALHVTITGTTAEGQTLGLDDLGQVIVEHSEKGQIVRFEMGFLNNYLDLKGGFPPTVSGEEETAERVVFRVPFSTPLFPNVQDVPDDRTLTLKMEFGSAMATRFGSNAVNVRVDMVEELDVAQTYDLRIQSQNQQAQGAGRITDTITGRNIGQMYLRDPGSVASEVNLQVDGTTVVDNTPFAVLQDETNILNRIESSVRDQPFVEIAIADNPVKESTENGGGDLAIQFSGAGIVDLYKFQYDWLPQAERNANIQKINAFLASKRRS